MGSRVAVAVGAMLAVLLALCAQQGEASATAKDGGGPRWHTSTRGRAGSSVKRRAELQLEEEEDEDDDSGVHGELAENVVNVGMFVGVGYDVYFGDPTFAGVDPGFRASIFDMNSFEEGKTTADGRHRVPDGAELKSSQSCSAAFESTVIDSAESFQRDMVKKSGFSLNACIAAFSGSSTFKKSKKRLETFHEATIDSRATCVVYTIHALLYEPPKLTSHFLNAVAEMSELSEMSEDEQKEFWGAFFQEFGTHIALTTNMGGRFGVRTTKSLSEINEARDSLQNVEASASVNAFVASAKASAKIKTQREEKSSRSQNSERSNGFTMGGEYSPDREVWMDNVKLEPMPVFVSDSRPLYWVFNPRVFPDDPNVAKKHDLVREALRGYCPLLVEQGFLSSCERPTIDINNDAMLVELDLPVLRGVFFESDKPRHSTPNPWTLEEKCPYRSQAHTAAQVVSSRGSVGLLKWCLHEDASLRGVESRRPKFGGMFARVEGHDDKSFKNPLTNDFACPLDFSPKVISLKGDGVEVPLSLCYLDGAPAVNGLKEEFGGLFALPTSSKDTHLEVMNPLAGFSGCALGFTQHLVGKRLLAASGQAFSLFACRSNKRSF